MRYIDADAIKYHEDDAVYRWEIDAMPTADVVPREIADEAYAHGYTDAESKYREILERKRGEWRYGENDIGLDGYWCTACGKFVLWNYNEAIDFIHRYNYCPNCGADMRGEDDE